MYYKVSRQVLYVIEELMKYSFRINILLEKSWIAIFS